MNRAPLTNADTARPRIGFIGWGEENAALWEALRSGPAGDAAEATLFVPGGAGAADAPLQPLPTVRRSSRPATPSSWSCRPTRRNR
ncbi:MAG: hypothetical protein O7A69_09420 [SAR324 cluster bacterium]|nr:hypothetical protein [SAR324 cluster bacterium]